MHLSMLSRRGGEAGYRRGIWHNKSARGRDFWSFVESQDHSSSPGGREREVKSTNTKTIQSLSSGTREKNKEDSNVVRVILPFKDQTSANAVKRQMCDLSHKIGTALQPVFTSRKLEQDLKPREIQSPIVNRQQQQ